MNKSMLAATMAMSLSTWAHADLVTLQMEGTIFSKQAFFDNIDPVYLPDLTDEHRAAVNGVLGALAIDQHVTATLTLDSGAVQPELFTQNDLYEVVDQSLVSDTDTIISLDDPILTPRMLSYLGPIGEHDVVVKAPLSPPILTGISFPNVPYTFSVQIPEAGIDFSISGTDIGAQAGMDIRGFNRVINPDTMRTILLDDGSSSLGVRTPFYEYVGTGRNRTPDLAQTVLSLETSVYLPGGQRHAESDLATILQGLSVDPTTNSARITVSDQACGMNPFQPNICGYVALNMAAVTVSSVVPEPGTFGLMGLGLVGVMAASMRRRREHPAR